MLCLSVTHVLGTHHVSAGNKARLKVLLEDRIKIAWISHVSSMTWDVFRPPLDKSRWLMNWPVSYSAGLYDP
jgi:hypothetical protein